jgi:hypothetical protein
MNSFLSKSSNLTTDKLYEQKYLKYKSKYLKYIEDNNKIQKGGAETKVQVKKISMRGIIYLAIVLWDIDAPPQLKLLTSDYKNYSISCQTYFINMTPEEISAIFPIYPNIHPSEQHPPIVADYLKNNKEIHKSIIINAFTKAKDLFTKDSELTGIELTLKN